jgi:hypothetical protein
VAFALPAAANAAVRYAEPGGDGPEPCLQADPCDIQRAVEGDFGPPVEVQDGDEVILLPGTYNLGSTAAGSVEVTRAIHVHGQSGQPRPVLVSSSGINVALFSNSAGARIGHLEVEHASGFAGLLMSAGTAEGVIVESTAGGIACHLGNVTLRDSVCWAPAVNAAAVARLDSSGAAATRLRNVTAVAPNGSNSHGIRLSASSGGANEAIDAKSVIADGGVSDVSASASGSSSATVTLDHSNYATETESAAFGSTATVTNPGSGSNQTAAPAFVNAAGGDFHQAAGSPTIDAGATDGASGSADIDSQPRHMGDDPDIGADEASGPLPRYAEPGGNGPATECPQTDPCDIETAIEHTSVAANTDVIVLPGTYSAGELQITKSVDVHGAQGQPRPRIVSTDGTALDVAEASAKVSHLELESSGPALFMSQGGTAERMVAHATGGAAACLSPRTATLRDSVCWHSGSGGTALDMNLGTSTSTAFTTTLRNVTAVATGSTSTGISVVASQAAQLTIDGKNVIADGTSVDASATTTIAAAGAFINLSHSNFATRNASGQGTESVTDPTTENNVTTAPVFVDAADGDFHQTTASTGTLDLGTADAQNGTTDFDGEARTAGATIDIGADEYIDTDGDLDPDYADNCPGVANADQADNDGDGQGNSCDADDDNDGLSDVSDNCDLLPNPDQFDNDSDGQGNVCDDNDDADTVPDASDNCQFTANEDQANNDGDAEGDACDFDDDNDTRADGTDNCPLAANLDQADNDGDGPGDVCDDNDDTDSVPDATDNCQLTANEDQANNDGDAEGDACDGDDDNDSVADGADNCALVANAGQANTDGDPQGDACDADDDGDGVADAGDSCPTQAASTSDGCPAAVDDGACAAAQAKLDKAKKKLKKLKRKDAPAPKIKKAKKKVKKAKQAVAEACA